MAKPHRLATVLYLVLLLAALQLLRAGTLQLLFLWVPRTNTASNLASMMLFFALSGVLVALAHTRVPFRISPPRAGAFELGFTVLFALLLVSGPVLAGGIQPAGVIQLAYGCIATPIFEELLFRGLVWHTLNQAFTGKWACYLISTLLFGLWHLGYADNISFRVQTGLTHILLWKVLVGLAFGLVLGTMRLWRKDCYSCMLLHGAMNVFGR